MYFFANAKDGRSSVGPLPVLSLTQKAFNLSNTLFAPIHHLVGTPKTHTSDFGDTLQSATVAVSAPHRSFLRRLFSFKGLASVVAAIPALIIGSLVRGGALLSSKIQGDQQVGILKASRAIANNPSCLPWNYEAVRDSTELLEQTSSSRIWGFSSSCHRNSDERIYDPSTPSSSQRRGWFSCFKRKTETQPLPPLMGQDVYKNNYLDRPRSGYDSL